MKITLKRLRRLGACSEQVALFKETFGTEVEITESVVLEHGAKFDITWLASRLFSEELWAEYLAKRAPLYAEYLAKCASLDAEYLAKCAMLNAEYLAKCAPLYVEYLAKRAQLYAEYLAKRTLAFWECLKKMEVDGE